MTHNMDANEVRFFSGRSHPNLAEKISSHLGVPLEQTFFSKFSNDNLFIQLGASVRSRKVFIVQSLVPPVSDHLLELLMMLDIAKSAAAREIHAIIPYFSYARSDKKNAPRISITARLIADLLQTAGATHVMTMTLHSPQVHGFFSVPTDPLTARMLFSRHLKEKMECKELVIDPSDTVVVAPDYGRAGSAARLASQLNLSSLAAEKKRISDTEVHISDSIVKQVKGFKRVIIYDDEIATGGSVIKLCNMIRKGTVEDIILICTHGIFLREALDRIFSIPEVSRIITTDTVPVPPEKQHEKLTILSVATVIGDAIWRNYTRQSIGGLFEHGDE